jgi:hypothetical protein
VYDVIVNIFVYNFLNVIHGFVVLVDSYINNILYMFIIKSLRNILGINLDRNYMMVFWML